MPLYKKPIQLNTHIVGLWDIQENHALLIDKVDKLGYSSSEQADFKSELKQKQWLAARCLLNSIDPSIKEIKYCENGAPYLDKDLYISFSHSHYMAAVILDKSHEVGIDIQFFTEKIKKIEKKFCSIQEMEYAAGESNLEKLHVIWSAKEAIFKKMKIPGLIFKEQIAIDIFEMSNEGGLSATVILPEGEKRVQLEYQILGDYTLVYTSNP